ncbi:MAG: hypothetical protein IPG32_17710 [Saprospirales bacterium]|nr:hypothetical protein [Saprospirales bacterium]
MNQLILILLVLAFPLLAMGQRISYDSTFQSNGLEFRVQQIQLEKYMSILKITNGERIVLEDTLDFFTDLQLIDFNDDKSIDIQIRFMGNVDTQSLYLFDFSKNRFQKVVGFEKFPEAKRVKISEELYYSYHRSGCADNYWTSDLFKINDFNTTQLGKIFGEGCEDPMQVKVYKIGQNKKDLVETLPYKVVEENRDNKWGFIADYWAKNYKRFR